MGAISLQLQRVADGGGAVQAFLLAPSRQQALALQLPPQLLRRYQAWRTRFLLHYGKGEPPASVVAIYGRQLVQALEAWVKEDPAWLPLRQALEASPEAPLLIGSCDGDLEQLPWELLSLDGLVIGRPIWRQPPQPGLLPLSRPQPGPRQPRVLVLVGDERNLDVKRELACLEALEQQRGITLRLRRGDKCSLAALRTDLEDPLGWDALVFLGHSNPDPLGGGRLQLGDGAWVSASAFLDELRIAAARGLRLLLLNSCSGIDLAHSAAGVGVDWTVCFREALPARAAGVVFTELLAALQGGMALSKAVAQTRRALRQHPELVDIELLLSVYSSGLQQDMQLPLSRRLAFQKRLAHSTAAQLGAAGVCLAMAAGSALVPWNPLSTYLLDRRLVVQRLWRDLSGQHGPSAEPVGVVLVDPGRVQASDGSDPASGVVPRLALAQILERTPAITTRVGLDVVFDREAPDTEALASVLQRQRRPLVVSGWIGPDAGTESPGRDTATLAVPLQSSGLSVRLLDVNTPGRHSSGERQPLPLRLQKPLTADHFAAALAGATTPMPADAVIDWSLDWPRLIQRLQPADLAATQVQILLVGTNGALQRDYPDLFDAPGAAAESLAEISGGSARAMPGVLVQAALVQSLRLQHWLMPVSMPAITALTAGLGVLLAAAIEQRRRRWLVLGVVAAVALPVALQLAISTRRLVPLLLPLSALTLTAQLRRP
ncbi:MAG: CHAT domain-containing protein [Synechococcaceae cyanobacterium]|nr:CHAT domain-containing protein [Synechococcaceae cyanobacterium]